MNISSVRLVDLPPSIVVDKIYDYIINNILKYYPFSTITGSKLNIITNMKFIYEFFKQHPYGKIWGGDSPNDLIYYICSD